MRNIFTMKIRALRTLILAGTSLLSCVVATALEAEGASDDITGIFRVTCLVTLFAVIITIVPIPLAWNQPYLNEIKKNGAVHYTNAEAAENIKKEGFIRPSNRMSSYSNLFRRCAYLSSPAYREVTLFYNKMKGKVDENSEKIFVPYNEETFKNAKFRLMDMSIMIPGGVKL